MKILLICAAGMSTSLVVQKMKKEILRQGKDYEVFATGASEAMQIANDWDVLLIGPQVRNELERFSSKFPGKPAEVIPPMFYGRQDGKAIVKLAEELVSK